MPRIGRSDNRRLCAARVVIATGVIILAWAGFEFNHDTPWAYLNVIFGALLAGYSWHTGLKAWLIVLALPLWNAIEVSIYYPWADPGIPISMFINPLLGMAVLITVLISPVEGRQPRNERLMSHTPDAPPR